MSKSKLLSILVALIGVTMLFGAACSDENTSSSVVQRDDNRFATLAGLVRESPPRGSSDLNKLALQAGFKESEIASALQVYDYRFGNLQAQVAPGGTCPQDYHVDAHKEFDVPAGCNSKGDVSVFLDNKWTALYDSGSNSANTGLIVSCPEGCKIRPDFDGANVTPRDIANAYDEMRGSGCGLPKGCSEVVIYVIKGGKATKTTVDDSGKGGSSSTPDTSKAGTPSATPTAVTTPQPLNDGCEPEMKILEKRVVKKGCIVVGDVAIRTAGSTGEFRPVYDNKANTGTVQLLDADYEVWNTQGAGIYPAGTPLEAAVTATKMGGCGTGFGCPGGIYDWKGNRLDTP